MSHLNDDTTLNPYARLLIALQPPGDALPTEPSSNWVKLLQGLSLEMERLDERLAVLGEELSLSDYLFRSRVKYNGEKRYDGEISYGGYDANNRPELLELWEQALGLPDPCAPAPKAPELRFKRIKAKLFSHGGHSKSFYDQLDKEAGKNFYTDLLDKLGYASTQEDLHPFEMGKKGMGDGVGGNEWRSVWHITIDKELPADELKLAMCVINQVMPAHAVVMWSMAGAPPEHYIPVEF